MKGRHIRTDLPHLNFKIAGAENIPSAGDYDNFAVSALSLNFFPDPAAGLREMGRVVKPGGEIALYVWDYAEGMQMLRYFWDVVIALDPEAKDLDEKVRFPICQPEALGATFTGAGLKVKEVRALEAATVFENFDDYWQPFLGGVGPAPGYVGALSGERRTELASVLREVLSVQADGSIPLSARAWAVKAYV